MIKNFLIENSIWMFPLIYILGSFVYYTILYEAETKKDVDRVTYFDVFIDLYVAIFWLPIIFLNIARAILAGVYFLFFKGFTKIFYRKKKRG